MTKAYKTLNNGLPSIFMFEFAYNHLLETLSFRMILNEEQFKIACFR